VAEHTDQLDGHGRRLVVRNGRHQARQVLTSSGAIEVVAPRVNGFTVRRQSGKLLIKPSKAALRRIRERLRTEMRALRGANAFAVVKRLNPIIRGWAAYYRTVVSSKIFQALDAYMWKLAYKWAKHSHQSKPKRWIVGQYFGVQQVPARPVGVR